ncbi:hypothetical protein F2Q69_00029401 [Brassica cretica]|uniref:Uncharacterized protein n=1 Tax=Brassica cretica TaxID=69181 RepID=A0A8S9S0U0_BRACR|nr:hypothetical protein F2Q69_00029401 [Brassica cretica]
MIPVPCQKYLEKNSGPTLRKRPSTSKKKKEKLKRMPKLIDKKEQTSIDKPRFSPMRYRSITIGFIGRFSQRPADERRTMRRFDTNSPAPVRDGDPWPRQPEDGPIPLFDHFTDMRKAAKSLECRNRAIENA